MRHRNKGIIIATTQIEILLQRACLSIRDLKFREYYCLFLGTIPMLLLYTDTFTLVRLCDVVKKLYL